MIEECFDIAENGPRESTPGPGKASKAAKPRIDPSSMTIQRSKVMVHRSRSKTPTGRKATGATK